VLYVGRVEERKGVHVLLDAFEHVIAPKHPDARLRIIGPNSYWNAQPTPFYARLAERCRAHPRVELCGPTYVDSELADQYRRAAIAVVPSVFPEALGLTPIEAQASGVPVVVSNAGGLPETVSAGASGLIFENGDADALGACVLELLADEPRRRCMAAAARAWAMTRFSWDLIAEQLEAVYVDLVPSSAGAVAG
jgi:glycosyltransferase involved in cell wall biosynthesis